MTPFRLLAGVLALTGLVLTAPQPADAKPGATLESSIKAARAHKKDIMGVIYFVKGGKVVKESWNSEMSGWPVKTADRYRALLIGAKKLKAQKPNKRGTLFTYTDGTQVQYNEARGVIITLDVMAPSYKPADEGAGKYQEVADWKEAPWKGRPW